jgi:hypothetical protein
MASVLSLRRCVLGSTSPNLSHCFHLRATARRTCTSAWLFVCAAGGRPAVPEGAATTKLERVTNRRTVQRRISLTYRQFQKCFVSLEGRLLQAASPPRLPLRDRKGASARDANRGEARQCRASCGGRREVGGKTACGPVATTAANRQGVPSRRSPQDEEQPNRSCERGD